MIWSVDGIMDYLTKDMDLKPGDLIYTGTPAGVGPVTVGDELSGGIEGLERITVRFVWSYPTPKSLVTVPAKAGHIEPT